ncbi:unnamed protein product, partial [Rotaria magnacalcarata]
CVNHFPSFCLDNNYNHSYGQMSMTNANISYTQSPPPSQQQPQQSTPIINQEKPEPQLIIFD